MSSSNPKSIDFCIPFISRGLIYFDYLLENCLSLADYPDRINFLVSYHTKEDLLTIQNSKHFDKLKMLIHVPAFAEKMLFVGSANHSAAINEFARVAKSDLFIVSDYDMAFLYSGWDTFLENVTFNEGKLICGTAYSNLSMKFLYPPYLDAMPWLKFVNLSKYQRTPNLSFFSISLQALNNFFSRRLTDFDTYLSRGGIPFRIISTADQAVATNLKPGAVQWLDTGWEIPEKIKKHSINYEVFNYQSLDEQVILTDTTLFKNLPPILHPEFFCLSDGTPFICHYKKGSAKSESTENIDLFKVFTEAIDDYLVQLEHPESMALVKLST